MASLDYSPEDVRTLSRGTAAYARGLGRRLSALRRTTSDEAAYWHGVTRLVTSAQRRALAELRGKMSREIETALRTSSAQSRACARS